MCIDRVVILHFELPLKGNIEEDRVILCTKIINEYIYELHIKKTTKRLHTVLFVEEDDLKRNTG